MINSILKIKISYVLFCILVIVIVAVFFASLSSARKFPEQAGTCIPTFVDGGGPYYKDNSPFRKKIVPDRNNGEKLVIRGRVLENDCKTPVKGAVIDIWQANEEGSYVDEYYRGKVKSDKNGMYKFETIVPKGYGEGTAFRPPHIHFKVFIDEREIITSQMFFPEVKGTPGFNDAYIMRLESKRRFGNTSHKGYHDIILP